MSASDDDVADLVEEPAVLMPARQSSTRDAALLEAVMRAASAQHTPPVHPASYDVSSGSAVQGNEGDTNAPVCDGAADAAADKCAAASPPPCVADFVRNYLGRVNLPRVLDAFNTDFYEAKERGMLPAHEVDCLPDIFVQNAALVAASEALRSDLESAQALAARAASTWERFRCERDHHRTNHARVVGEKNALIRQMRRLRLTVDKYVPLLEAMRTRHDAAIREKALARLECDRALARAAQLQAALAVAAAGGVAGVGLEAVPQHTATSSSAGRARGPGGPVGGFRHPTASSTPRLSEMMTARGAFVPAQQRVGFASALLARVQREREQVVDDDGTATCGPSVAATATCYADSASPEQPPPDSPVAFNTSDPYHNVDFDPARGAAYSLVGTISGSHAGGPVSCVSFATQAADEPPLLVTGGDDGLWRLWRHLGVGNDDSAVHRRCSLTGGAPAATSRAARTARRAQRDDDRRGDGDVALDSAWLSAVAVHPCGYAVATARGNGAVELWSLTTAQALGVMGVRTGGDASGAKAGAAHAGAAWDCAWHCSGDFLASGGQDRCLRVWDASTKRAVATLRGHADAVLSTTFQPNTSLLASGGGDKVVSLWDTRAGRCVSSLNGHGNAVSALAFSLRGDVLASADADGVVRLWDTRRATATAATQCTVGAVRALSFDRSGTLLAVGCDDGYVRVLQTVAAAAPLMSAVAQLGGHSDAVHAVAFDPTATFLVSGGSDGTVRLWSDYDTDELLPPRTLG